MRMVIELTLQLIPCGLVVRIQPSHGCGRGSIPRMGICFYFFFFAPAQFKKKIKYEGYLRISIYVLNLICKQDYVSDNIHMSIVLLVIT